MLEPFVGVKVVRRRLCVDQGVIQCYSRSDPKFGLKGVELMSSVS
jgi:hypothetical protein